MPGFEKGAVINAEVDLGPVVGSCCDQSEGRHHHAATETALRWRRRGVGVVVVGRGSSAAGDSTTNATTSTTATNSCSSSVVDEDSACSLKKPHAAAVVEQEGAAELRTDLTKDAAPPHVTYPYIVRGYRAGGSYARNLCGLFELHVETWNAWTMVWCALLSALALLPSALSALAADGGGGGGSAEPPRFWRALPDAAPFWALTGAVLLHAPWSIGFHLFRGMGPRTANLWRRLDQVFIFQASQLLAFGTGYFVYETTAGVAVNLAIAFVVAQAATVELVQLKPDYRRDRAAMVAFVSCIALAYWAPMGVQLVRDGRLAALHARAALLPPAAAAAAASPAALLLPPLPPPAAACCALATLAALVAGGIVYAAGWPERAYPGKFDLWFFSHPLMHVAATAAHVLEYAFVLEMARRRRGGAALA